MNKRLKWRFSNLMGDTPSYVTKLQMIWVGVVTAIASSDAIFSTQKHVQIIAIVGVLVDKIVIGGLAYEDEVHNV